MWTMLHTVQDMHSLGSLSANQLLHSSFQDTASACSKLPALLHVTTQLMQVL